jgi:hypothetical protein
VRVPTAVVRYSPTLSVGVVPAIADTVQPTTRTRARSVEAVAKSAIAPAAEMLAFVNAIE